MKAQRIDVELRRHPSAPALARSALEPLQANHAALFIVGELVAHAVTDGAPPISLAATRIEDVLWIEVCDGSDTADGNVSDAVRLIVDAYATDWGIERRDNLTCVWAIVID